MREHASAREELADLVLKLTESSIRLKASLPAPIVSSLADLVRSMNCYYSNLIEGHDTHPIDIERALKNDFSADPKQRDLQLEARAHISVQAWVDEGGWMAAQLPLKESWKFIRGSVQNSPTTCYGSRTKTPTSVSAFSRENIGNGTLSSAGTSRSALERCRGSCRALRKVTQSSEKWMPFRPQRVHTTDCSGCTRS